MKQHLKTLISTLILTASLHASGGSTLNKWATQDYMTATGAASATR
jgi:hypothetical protein